MRRPLLLFALALLATPVEAATVCGDARIAPSEGCDDGGHTSGDGCSSICTVEPGWVCTGWPSACGPITCGDGLLSAGEECDDGNASSGDGCDACVIEAGWVPDGDGFFELCPGGEASWRTLGTPDDPWDAVMEPVEGAERELTVRPGFVAHGGLLYGDSTGGPFLFDLDGDGDIDGLSGAVNMGVGESLRIAHHSMSSALDAYPTGAGGYVAWTAGETNEAELTRCEFSPDAAGVDCEAFEFANWPEQEVHWQQDGTWPEPGTSGFVTWRGAPVDMSLVDVNADGVRDLVLGMTTPDQGPFGLIDFYTSYEEGPGLVCDPTSLDCVTLPNEGIQDLVAAADFDGSGEREVLLGAFPRSVCNWPFLCTEQVDSYPAALCSPAGACDLLPDPSPDAYTEDIAIGDFDGDGDLDLLRGDRTYNPNLPALPVELLFNDGVGAFSYGTPPTATAAHTRALRVGDVDGDGDLDVVRGSELGDDQFVEVCLNDGSAAFACQPPLPDATFAYNSYVTLDLEDRDGDGVLELSTLGHPWSNDGTGTFAPMERRAHRLSALAGDSHGITSDLLGAAAPAPTRVYLRPTQHSTDADGASFSWWLHGDDGAPIASLGDLDGPTVVAVPPRAELRVRLEGWSVGAVGAVASSHIAIDALTVATCVLDTDTDGDGCDDLIDPRPEFADTDSDGDGLADDCDDCFDADGDGLAPAGASPTDGCMGQASDRDDDDRFRCVAGYEGCDHCRWGWYSPSLAGDIDGDGLCADADLDDDGDGCVDDEDPSPGLPSADLDGDGLGADCDVDDTDACVPYSGQAECPNSPPSPPVFLLRWARVATNPADWSTISPAESDVVILRHGSDDWHEPLTYEVEMTRVEDAQSQSWWTAGTNWDDLPFPSGIDRSWDLLPGAGPEGTENRTTFALEPDDLEAESFYRLRARSIDSLGAVSTWVQGGFVTSEQPPAPPPAEESGCSVASTAPPPAWALFLVPLVWRRRRVGFMRRPLLLFALALLATPVEAATVCGDARIAPSEGCDDGGHTSGDGCSSICTVEPGWVCTGWPSACGPITCGDGLLSAGEECDDGNASSGDGCDACVIEAGWVPDGDGFFELCPGGEASWRTLGTPDDPWDAVMEPVEGAERELTVRPGFVAHGGNLQGDPGSSYDGGPFLLDLDGDGDLDGLGGAVHMGVEETLRIAQHYFGGPLDTYPTEDGGFVVWTPDDPNEDDLRRCERAPGTMDVSCMELDFDGWPTQEVFWTRDSASPFPAGEGYVTWGSSPVDMVLVDLDGDGVREIVMGMTTLDTGPFGGVDWYYLTQEGPGLVCDQATRDCVVLENEGVQQIVAAADFGGYGERQMLLGPSPRSQCNWPFLCVEVEEAYPPALCTPAGTCGLLPSAGDDAATRDLAIGDFDGDGDLDFLRGDVPYGPNPPPLAVQLLLNNGQGYFSYGAPLNATPAYTRALRAGDVDSDGDLDVVRGSVLGDEQFVEVCLNDGAANFTCGGPLPGATFASYSYVNLDLIDRDGDGVLELSTRLENWENDGSGGFVPADTWAWRLSPTRGSSDGITSDLLDTTGVQTTRVLLRTLQHTAAEDAVSFNFWLHTDAGAAPVELGSLDTANVFTVPPSSELRLRLKGWTEGDWGNLIGLDTLTVAVCTTPMDADGDGCDDVVDPRPDVFDVDSDGDGLADECDQCFDADGDGLAPEGALAVDGCLDEIPDVDDGDRFVCVPGVGGCDACARGWYSPRLSGDLDGDGVCDEVDDDRDGDGCWNDDDLEPSVPSTDGDGDGVNADCDADDQNPCDNFAGHIDCPNEPPTRPRFLSPPLQDPLPPDEWDPVSPTEPLAVLLRDGADLWHEPLTYELQLARVPSARQQEWWMERGWLDETFPEQASTWLLEQGAGAEPEPERTSMDIEPGFLVPGAFYRLRARSIDALGAASDWDDVAFVTIGGGDTVPPPPDEDGCSCSGSGSSPPTWALFLVPLGWRRRA